MKNNKDVLLGVNIDHVATLRQARGGQVPNVLEAAKVAMGNGADGITVHLREDRRHIQDQDVIDLRKIVPRLNLEMATSPDIIKRALEVIPNMCTLVPEKRQELTTEGGLDVISNFNSIAETINKLSIKNIDVSLFIDPDLEQIKKGKETGAKYIEIHTGRYADAENDSIKKEELNKIIKASEFAQELDFIVNAGHGLNYENTRPIAQIKGMNELNIGHSIISRAVFTGIGQAASEMKNIMQIK